MTEKEREGFEKLVEDVEGAADDETNKSEIRDIQEFRKDHLYHGTKRMKHVPPGKK